VVDGCYGLAVLCPSGIGRQQRSRAIKFDGISPETGKSSRVRPAFFLSGIQFERNDKIYCRVCYQEVIYDPPRFDQRT